MSAIEIPMEQTINDPVVCSNVIGLYKVEVHDTSEHAVLVGQYFRFHASIRPCSMKDLILKQKNN